MKKIAISLLVIVLMFVVAVAVFAQAPVPLPDADNIACSAGFYKNWSDQTKGNKYRPALGDGRDVEFDSVFIGSPADDTGPEDTLMGVVVSTNGGGPYNGLYRQVAAAFINYSTFGYSEDDPSFAMDLDAIKAAYAYGITGKQEAKEVADALILVNTYNDTLEEEVCPAPADW